MSFATVNGRRCVYLKDVDAWVPCDDLAPGETIQYPAITLKDYETQESHTLVPLFKDTEGK